MIQVLSDFSPVPEEQFAEYPTPGLGDSYKYECLIKLPGSDVGLTRFAAISTGFTSEATEHSSAGKLWAVQFNTKNNRLVFEDLNHNEFPMQGTWAWGNSYSLIIEVENGLLSSNVLADPFPIIVAPMTRLQISQEGVADGAYGPAMGFHWTDQTIQDLGAAPGPEPEPEVYSPLDVDQYAKQIERLSDALVAHDNRNYDRARNLTELVLDTMTEAET